MAKSVDLSLGSSDRGDDVHVIQNDCADVALHHDFVRHCPCCSPPVFILNYWPVRKLFSIALKLARWLLVLIIM